MPISHQKNIFSVLNLVDDIQKRLGVSSILDIGAGFGKYGLLLRERLDIRFLRYNKPSWITRIDAVEPYSDYITPVHKYIYDNIYLDKIENLASTLPNYDIILMIDCLEHLEKSTGEKLLTELDSKTNKLLILSFPNIYQARAGADWINDLERHRCLWTKEDLTFILGPVNHHKFTIYVKDKTNQTNQIV